MQQFLLELGKGFSFVGRQQRIKIGEKYFYIDLVFYNRFTRSFVLIDLKVGELTHQDIGQMQMYVNYYKREITTPEENPPIGIILCAKKEALFHFPVIFKNWITLINADLRQQMRKSVKSASK